MSCRRQQASIPENLPGEIHAQAREDGQREDLRDQARDHDIDALVQERLLLCDGRDGAAGSLQDDGHDVGADEDVRVGVGRDARVLGAEEQDEALEHDVQTRGEEGGGDC